MLIQATQKYSRQTPRKLRVVANTVKKMPIEVAFNQLAVIERRSSITIAQVLRQAVANAIHNHGYQLSDLSIENIFVNEGPRYKRFQAVSRGRAHTITKKTSHVTVILKSNESEKTKTEVKKEAVQPTKKEKAPAAVDGVKKPVKKKAAGTKK